MPKEKYWDEPRQECHDVPKEKCASNVVKLFPKGDKPVIPQPFMKKMNKGDVVYDHEILIILIDTWCSFFYKSDTKGDQTPHPLLNRLTDN